MGSAMRGGETAYWLLQAALIADLRVDVETALDTGGSSFEAQRAAAEAKRAARQPSVA